VTIESNSTSIRIVLVAGILSILLIIIIIIIKHVSANNRAALILDHCNFLELFRTNLPEYTIFLP
jgi:hypothetical protein